VSKPSTLGLSGLAPVDEPESVDVRPDAAAPLVGVARRNSKRRRTRWLLIVVASMLVANALAGERGLLARLTAGRAHGALTAGIADIRRENAALRERIRRLREDPREIEAVAREELGLLRPGERLFIVKRTPQPPVTRR
jgi:cell division protein FtsB